MSLFYVLIQYLQISICMMTPMPIIYIQLSACFADSAGRVFKEVAKNVKKLVYCRNTHERGLIFRAKALRQKCYRQTPKAWRRGWCTNPEAEFWSPCGGWHAGHPQSSLTIKHYNALPYMASLSGHKFGFTQSNGGFYGGIVAVFIEFTVPTYTISTCISRLPTQPVLHFDTAK